MNAMNYLAITSWIDFLKLPYSLPIKEGWNIPDYPVVPRTHTSIVFLYSIKNKCHAEVRIAMQDGFSVGSFSFMVGGGGSSGDGGSSFAPGRKWGEFPSHNAADLFYSRDLLKHLIDKGKYSIKHKKLTEPCIKELIKHINSINLQMELFA
jgi:hypothetical protein